MKRNMAYFSVSYNGRKWYAVAASFGPYTNVDEAMAAAEFLNRRLKESQAKRSRAVIREFKERVQ